MAARALAPARPGRHTQLAGLRRDVAPMQSAHCAEPGRARAPEIRSTISWDLARGQWLAGAAHSSSAVARLNSKLPARHWPAAPEDRAR